MKVNLVRFRKNGSSKSFSLLGNPTIIGRQRDCNLRIPVVSVSKKHCRIRQVDGALKICDLGSRNGTFLDNKRLSKEEVDVQAGSSLRIGPVMFLFQIDGKPEKLVPPKFPAKKTLKAEEPQQPQAAPAPEALSIQQAADVEDTAEEQIDGLSDLADLEELEKLDSPEEA
jgi:pSer/pThr/pTyr-binding forkhead associated (FHA) protein